MTAKTKLFRRVLNAILEGRNAQAKRQIEQYLRVRSAEQGAKR
jgi:hypothetical protein